MKIVAPLRVEAEPANAVGWMTRGSLQIALGDQPGVAAQTGRLGVKRVGELGEDGRAPKS